MNRSKLIRQRGWRFDLTSAGIGSMLTLAAVAALGATVVAMTPVEIYRSAPATVHPVPGKRTAAAAPVELPPCVGEGKDCSEIEPPSAGVRPQLPDGFVWPDAASAPPPVATLPDAPTTGREIPEPGTLALLLAAGVALAAWRMR